MADKVDDLQPTQDLRKQVTRLALQLRKRGGAAHDFTPRYVSYDQLRLNDGSIVGRKKVILMTSGCSVPTCTMCPFTSENNFGRARTMESLVQQVEAVLMITPDEPEYEVLALYNDGSFFADVEISREVRRRIAQLVAASPVRQLVVESLPQFITRGALTDFVAELGDVSLEIGIGLQSSDELVRETLVNTRVTKVAFESALRKMRDLDVSPKVYLMIKPPFLTEEEALLDTSRSVDYLREIGIDGVTLCPTRVARGTVAWELYHAGSYTPPNLWTVLQTVQDAHSKANVRVACINLRGSDFESVFPSSCDSCADLIVDRLLAYGESGDVDLLDITCACRPEVTPAVVLDYAELRTRAAEMLGAIDRH
jgi:radical SAM enzyme (TIGR01210 family)